MKHTISKKWFLLLLPIFLILLFFVSSQGLIVILIAAILVLIDKCLLGRINPIGGIEFITIATVLATLKYGISGGFFLCIFIILVPPVVNAIIGSRFLVNPDFNPISFGPGNVRDFISVLLIYLLKPLDILWIVIAISLFKNLAKFEGFDGREIITIPINLVFNVVIVLYFKDFLTSLLL